MENLIDVYLSFLRQLKEDETNAYSPVTFVNYREKLTTFQTFIAANSGLSLSAQHISQVTADSVDAFRKYQRERMLMPATRDNYAAILKGFFAFLVHQKIIQTNPAAHLRRVVTRYNPTPPPAIDDRYFTVDEIELIHGHFKGATKCIDLRDYAMMVIMVYTGLRISEVCGVNMNMTKPILLGGYLQVLSKGGNWDRVELPPFAVECVKKYLTLRGLAPDDAPMFISLRGNRMSRVYAWQRYALHQRAINIRTGTHRLRHSSIHYAIKTLGFEAGFVHSRHRDRRTTMVYAHYEVEAAKARTASLPFAPKNRRIKVENIRTT